MLCTTEKKNTIFLRNLGPTRHCGSHLQSQILERLRQESPVQGLPGLHNMFKISLNNLGRYCLLKLNNKINFKFSFLSIYFEKVENYSNSVFHIGFFVVAYELSEFIPCALV